MRVAAHPAKALPPPVKASPPQVRASPPPVKAFRNLSPPIPKLKLGKKKDESEAKNSKARATLDKAVKAGKKQQGFSARIDKRTGQVERRKSKADVRS